MPVAPQTTQALLEALTRAGLDVRRLGVNPIDDDAAMALLWAHAIARVGRRTLPLEVGLAMPLGSMGAVDYLAASSATVGAALTVTQQVFPLVAPGVQLLLEPLRAGARRVVVVNHPPFPGQLESDLLVLGILLSRLRQFARRPLALPQLDLAEPEPTARANWLRLIDAPRVKFGTRRTALHLSAIDWAVPLRNADARDRKSVV